MVIGGTGGSGTSVFGRMLRTLGLDIGETLPQRSEWRGFNHFTGWIRPLVAHDLGGHPVDFAAAAADLGVAVAQHPAMAHDRPWGFKRPLACLVIEFLNDCMPTMRFIHVVRDGRDMALSKNQTQAALVSDLFVQGGDFETPSVRSAASWSAANRWVRSQEERVLPDRFLVVRFEDLMSQPTETLQRAAEFAGLSADADQFDAAVQLLRQRKPSVGRWLDLAPAERDAVSVAAQPGLRMFGYIGGEADS